MGSALSPNRLSQDEQCTDDQQHQCGKSSGSPRAGIWPPVRTEKQEYSQSPEEDDCNCEVGIHDGKSLPSNNRTDASSLYIIAAMDTKPSKPEQGDTTARVLLRLTHEQFVARRPHESAVAYALRLLFDMTAIMGTACIAIGTANLFYHANSTAFSDSMVQLGSMIGGPSVLGGWILRRRQSRAERKATEDHSERVDTISRGRST